MLRDLEATATNTAKKTVASPITKKTTLHVQHTFFVHFFAAICTTTT